MACHKDCKPPEWTETEMQKHPRTGQPAPGTGIVKLKAGTGCIYTREGSGCCLLPIAGAVQPSDLANPKIAERRRELVAADLAAAEAAKDEF